MNSYPLIAHARSDGVVAWRNGQAITAADFLDDVHQLAQALPSGGHVLNACADRYHFAVGMAAAVLTGKVSLLPPSLTPEMIRQVRAFAPDVFCLTDQSQPIDLPQVCWGDALPEGARFDARTGEFQVPEIPGDRVTAIVFTSGSTGSPVAHVKRWAGLVQSVRAEASRLGLTDGRNHSIVATVAPQHMYGFESTVLVALQSGAAMVAAHPFYPADICAALAAAPRPSMLVTTPIHLKALLASGLQIPKTDLVLSATAAMPAQLAVAVEERMHAPLMEIYGSTETGQVASRRTTQGVEWSLYPGVTLHTADNNTWASGAHIEKPMVLADVIELLGEARFLLHGRTADLVNIAGKRSSLGYLNHQLNAIPGVVDGAFFMPDEAQEDSITRLMAFVVAPGMKQAALLATLRERIDKVFLPRPIVMLDALPRNSTGKLPRDVLSALADQHHRAGTPDAH